MKMDVKTFYGEYTVIAKQEKYAYGKGLAIRLLYLDDEFNSYMPFCVMTVNLTNEKLSNENCAFVDINNFPEAESLIAKYNLGKPTGNFGFSGMCVYPEYEFNLEELAKYKEDN